MNIMELVKKIIQKNLLLTSEEIENLDQNQSLIDFGLNSINFIEISVDLEDEFGINIGEVEAEKTQNINSIIKLVEAKLNK